MKPFQAYPQVQTKSPELTITEVHELFKNWRETRSKRETIPDELWTAAVQISQHFDIGDVARFLKLNYRSLKQKVESAALHTTQTEEKAFHFIELPPLPNNGTNNYIIDLRRPDDTTMHIRLQNGSAADIQPLIQAFIG